VEEIYKDTHLPQLKKKYYAQVIAYSLLISNIKNSRI